MTFAVRRAGEHIGRLSLLALVAALVVGGIGAIDAVSERLLAAGSSRILADAEPAARTLRVVALQAADGAAQDAEVRAAIQATFLDTDISIARQAEVDAAVTTASGDVLDLRLLEDARVPDLGRIAEGEWPRAPDEIAMLSAAAERYDLGVGDTVTLNRDGERLTVVGLWTADDPQDPAWHGETAVASGETDGVIGPAIVADDALLRLPGTARITWEIEPDRVGLDEIPKLQRASAALSGLPEEVDPQRAQNTRILGSLGDTLQRASTAVLATRGLLVAPLLIIALLGVLVLSLALSTLALARGEELRLLRARGASSLRLALSAATEAAAFVAAGALIALVPLAVTVGISVVALLTAVGAVVLAAAAAALFTVRSAGGADTVRPESVRGDANVRMLRTGLVPVGSIVCLAALSAWQLFTNGAVIRPDGSPDPLAAAAPALLIIAACTVAPVTAGLLAGLAERLLRRTRGAVPILPLRQIARRMGSIAVAILCLALAAASSALAAAAPTAAGAAEHRAQVALLGGDIRMISDDGVHEVAAAAATWDEVTKATELVRMPVTVGSDTAVLLAGPPAALGIEDGLASEAPGTIAAAVTRSLADHLGAEEGTVFTARIRSVARPVSIEIGRIVDALPGVGSGFGIAADPEELHAAGADLRPNELWLRSSTPVDTAAHMLTQATHPARILTAAQVSAAPVVSIAPALLAAGALVSAVLGVIGFLAAMSATARARRGESLVLRALGLRPARQRALRIGETLGVAFYAVLIGTVLGIAVAAAVLPVVLGAGT
ncbi:FtsX-like permease family protein [Microbacterium sp. AGC85]